MAVNPDTDRSMSTSHTMGASGLNKSAIRARESTTRNVIRGADSLATGAQRLKKIEQTPLAHHAVSLARLIGRSFPRASSC